MAAVVAAGHRASAQAPAGVPRDAGGYKAPTLALERGRAVYVLNHCHFCHGDDLTRANMGAANLTQSALVASDLDGNVIGAIVKAGLPNLQTAMPSYRDLTPQQIVDLARYLHYLRQQAKYNQLVAPKEGPAGDVPRGRAFFSGPGKCATCHSGKTSLAGVAKKYDAATLRTRLLRPGPAKPVEGEEPTTGQTAHLRLLESLTQRDVEDLLAYLRGLI